MDVFILSPANLAGIKAQRLLDPTANSPTARQLRSREGLPVGGAFEYLSSLYFRGKLAYARRFSRAAIYIIAPGFGLVAPDWKFSVARARRMQGTPVDARLSAYRNPLERTSLQIARSLPEDAEVVLLGSLAPRKYVDILLPCFGERLHCPANFKSMGDMKRGSVLLRAAREGVALRHERLAQALQLDPSCGAPNTS